MEAPLHITPFSIHIEAEILSDLRERIRKTRWPDQAPLGYALNDSPAGLAAWILEKWRS